MIQYSSSEELVENRKIENISILRKIVKNISKDKDSINSNESEYGKSKKISFSKKRDQYKESSSEESSHTPSRNTILYLLTRNNNDSNCNIESN